jgi:hypothetical protein
MCEAEGEASYAFGAGNIAYGDNAYVVGRYATMDNNKQYIFQVGNGTGSGTGGRSDAFTVKRDGTGTFKNGLNVGGSVVASGSMTMERTKKVASEDWVNTAKPGVKTSGKSYQTSLILTPITLNSGTEFDNDARQKYYYDTEKEKHVPCSTF